MCLPFLSLGICFVNGKVQDSFPTPDSLVDREPIGQKCCQLDLPKEPPATNQHNIPMGAKGVPATARPGASGSSAERCSGIG